ncbi:MAG: serine hydrolase domain-containing protein [Cytophagales bacterium]|nr:beta-lactamase family protein [Bernardetiaceae bacterium]MDW8205975.1 serine hydrolase domain-containing protein [Cytophagales bacterium]
MKKQAVFKVTIIGAVIIALTTFLLYLASNGYHCFSVAKQPATNAVPLTYRIVPPREPLQNSNSDTITLQVIDSAVEKFRTRWLLTGLSLAIAQHGRLIYAKGFGYANQEKQEAMTPQHRFRIASVSKLLTAAAVMQLVERGRVSLSDKVFGRNGILSDSMYLHAKDKRIYDIEVRHLLQHTGGWRNIFRADPMFIPLEIAAHMRHSPPINLDVIICFMLSQKMLAQPGTFFDYSNFGYCLLGRIIEKISGQSYESYVQQHLLAPLGIRHMQIGRNRYEERLPNEVTYYDHPGATLRPDIDGSGKQVTRPYGGTDVTLLGAAGGWIASPVELLRLVLSLDGMASVPDILSQESIRQMTCYSASNLSDTTRCLEMGWRYCNEREWVRTGYFGGTHAVVCRRQDGIAWVLLCNQSSWRGPYFSFELLSEMEKILSTVKIFPQRNLFSREPVYQP